MKKILLVYLPFCTPASPPYSLTNMHAFLKHNCNEQIEVLDLNSTFHCLKFPEFKVYYQNMENWDDYEKKTREYQTKTGLVYRQNNKMIVQGEKPEFFDVLLEKIREKKPDIVAFSIVYSSQAFYATALLKELKEVTTVIGGPAVNEKLIALASKYFSHEVDFLSFITGKEVDHEKLIAYPVLDFSLYDIKEYFTPSLVIPLRTSTTCYYQQCTFCSHYNKTKYYEFPLESLKETIITSGQKHFFFIDDMIPKRRLLQIAEMLKPLDMQWICQLRPTKEYDFETMQTLYESGLRMVMWGVESGNQRVLNLMKKGTYKEDIGGVLEASHTAGIKNVTFIMFGFPTETKEEFFETIDFLKMNKDNIDILSISIFGLQKDTPAYKAPELFGIRSVQEVERTVLEPKIQFTLESGLTHDEALALKKQQTRLFESINKYPTAMNFFREHLLCRIGAETYINTY